MASRQAATGGADHWRRLWVPDGDGDSSDEGDNVPFRVEPLPDAASSSVPLLRHRVERIGAKLAKLEGSRCDLRSALTESRARRDDFIARCSEHLEERRRCRQALLARVEALEEERDGLLALSERQAAELAQAEEGVQQAQAQERGLEARIQRLMDQMVSVLSAITDPTEARRQLLEVREELEAGAASLEEQLEHTREQCQATSSENRRRAIQLSGEQGRTKRMHDEFVLLQAELFARPTGQRGVRPEPPPEAPVPEARRLAATPPRLGGRGAALAAAERGVAPARLPRQAPAAAEPPPATPPPSPPGGPAGASHGSAAGSAGGTGGTGESPLQGASQALAGSEEDCMEYMLPADSDARSRLLEEKLRDVLEAADFESNVIRLGAGQYQFGSITSAWLHIEADDEVYALQDGMGVEPVAAFIDRISARDKASVDAAQQPPHAARGAGGGPAPAEPSRAAGSAGAARPGGARAASSPAGSPVSSRSEELPGGRSLPPSPAPARGGPRAPPAAAPPPLPHGPPPGRAAPLSCCGSARDLGGPARSRGGSCTAAPASAGGSAGASPSVPARALAPQWATPRGLVFDANHAWRQSQVTIASVPARAMSPEPMRPGAAAAVVEVRRSSPLPCNHTLAAAAPLRAGPFHCGAAAGQPHLGWPPHPGGPHPLAVVVGFRPSAPAVGPPIATPLAAGWR